jgi:prepilin-type N-terminal cleavage/methylation domain-containing protein
MKPSSRQAGITLIEMLISISIIAILVVATSTYFVNQLINAARTDTLSSVQSNTKQAIEIVAKDIRAARTVEATNVFADANGPGGNPYGWISDSSSPSTLVLAIPAVDSSGNLLYVDASHNAIYTNDVVYYIYNPNTTSATLYRRTIANPVVGNSATTTCPPPGTNTCPGDAHVVDNIANMVVSYYDTTDNTVATPTSSYSISVQLTEYQIRFNRKFNSTINSRISLRNKP